MGPAAQHGGLRKLMLPHSKDHRAGGGLCLASSSSSSACVIVCLGVSVLAPSLSLNPPGAPPPCPLYSSGRAQAC